MTRQHPPSAVTHPTASRPAGETPSWRAALLLLAACSSFAGLGSAFPTCALAQGTQPAALATTPGEERLTQPQLEQLLAPVALYPDGLLAQILMAATYPLELVEAARWLKQGGNAGLKGDALAKALEQRPWDPSVKSLLPFPSVLATLNDHLGWTQQLGDAVLAQQQDVLNAVQVLRGRAQAAGTLTSGPQQTVTVTQNVAAATQDATLVVTPPPQVIVIQPAEPDKIYVPAYNPSVVYGTWPYPQSPPVYYPPPPGAAIGTALLSGMAFAGGVALVGSLWGWASPGWGGGNVDIDVNRYNQINAVGNRVNSPTWRHDATHRHGVAYRDESVRNRFRGEAGTQDRSAAREEFRGRAQQAQQGGALVRRPGGTTEGPAGRRGEGTADRPRPNRDSRPSGLSLDRAGAAGQQRPGGAGLAERRAGDRPGSVDRPVGTRAAGHTASGRPAPQHAPQGATRPGGGAPAARAGAGGGGGRPGPQGFQGLGQGREEQAASQRGQSSRLGQAGAQRPQVRQVGAGGHGGGGQAGGRHSR
ncbi:DUF3300 domain-containing protein [Belnapia sp. T6]|uniref:DUF3300 domain-containing protein n=1 Tax=Belnapia mucosa TaxID=2804532 RepID=A0ABS1VBV1_9PROT|nr:DUF3300 domain-containing protein [Belnapia mucosa]MBL6459151.1 DUF3300 domain-containing protein [Belnapia mucosa]